MSSIPRDFLLLRDYAGMSVVFIALYGAAGLFAIPSIKIGLIYLLVLAPQYVLVRQAACNIESASSQRARPARGKRSPGHPKGAGKRMRNKAKADPSKEQA